jgi:hypothetical protein
MASCGHGDPKLAKLTEVLEDHFRSVKENGIRESRAMVFTSMRDSVSGICDALNELGGGLMSAKCAPLATFACAARHSACTLEASPKQAAAGLAD